jgi:hypothetical protein
MLQPPRSDWSQFQIFRLFSCISIPICIFICIFAFSVPLARVDTAFCSNRLSRQYPVHPGAGAILGRGSQCNETLIIPLADILAPTCRGRRLSFCRDDFFLVTEHVDARYKGALAFLDLRTRVSFDLAFLVLSILFVLVVGCTLHMHEVCMKKISSHLTTGHRKEEGEGERERERERERSSK